MGVDPGASTYVPYTSVDSGTGGWDPNDPCWAEPEERPKHPRGTTKSTMQPMPKAKRKATQRARRRNR